MVGLVPATDLKNMPRAASRPYILPAYAADRVHETHQAVHGLPKAPCPLTGAECLQEGRKAMVSSGSQAIRARSVHHGVWHQVATKRLGTRLGNTTGLCPSILIFLRAFLTVIKLQVGPIGLNKDADKCTVLAGEGRNQQTRTDDFQNALQLLSFGPGRAKRPRGSGTPINTGSPTTPSLAKATAVDWEVTPTTPKPPVIVKGAPEHIADPR